VHVVLEDFEARRIALDLVAGRLGDERRCFTVPSGKYRLATVEDPAGNTITLAQAL
jgi:hypothetical protein